MGLSSMDSRGIQYRVHPWTGSVLQSSSSNITRHKYYRCSEADAAICWVAARSGNLLRVHSTMLDSNLPCAFYTTCLGEGGPSHSRSKHWGRLSMPGGEGAGMEDPAGSEVTCDAYERLPYCGIHRLMVSVSVKR